MKKFKTLFEENQTKIRELIGYSVIDYAQYEEFVVRFTVGIESSYPYSNDSDNRFYPFAALLNFSVAYNHYTYLKLTKYLTGENIFPHKGLFADKEIVVERPKDADLIVLQLMKNRTLLIDNISRSFFIGREFQSIQQLRSYLEVCQLLFYLLTNRIAMKKFSNQELTPEEYAKEWWKSLSPSKVSANLKSEKRKIHDKFEKERVQYMDTRIIEPGGNKKHFDSLMSMCNDYIHFKKDAMYQHSYNKTGSSFNIALKDDFSSSSCQTLVMLIESLSYTTDWILEALACHINLDKQLDDDEYKFHNELNMIQQFFVLHCTYNGLYDFGKTATVS